MKALALLSVALLALLLRDVHAGKPLMTLHLAPTNPRTLYVSAFDPALGKFLSPPTPLRLPANTAVRAFSLKSSCGLAFQKSNGTAITATTELSFWNASHGLYWPQTPSPKIHYTDIDALLWGDPGGSTLMTLTHFGIGYLRLLPSNGGNTIVLEHPPHDSYFAYVPKKKQAFQFFIDDNGTPVIRCWTASSAKFQYEAPVVYEFDGAIYPRAIAPDGVNETLAWLLAVDPWGGVDHYAIFGVSCPNTTLCVVSDALIHLRDIDPDTVPVTSITFDTSSRELYVPLGNPSNPQNSELRIFDMKTLTLKKKLKVGLKTDAPLFSVISCNAGP